MAGKPTNSLHVETELSRDFGLWTALAIGVGTMIAAGIFTLSGLAIRNVGSAALVSFLLAAVVAMFTALAFCEFAALYPETGGGYLYARRTLRPLLAYFVGWTLFLGYTSSCAFYIASLSSYFHEFIWHTAFPGAFGAAALVALTLINVKGTKESGTFQVVVTVAKILLLAWFAIAGLSAFDAEDFAARFDGNVFRIGGTAAMVFITFFGFSAIAASAGEIKDPVKNIPRAILLSMAIVTVLYAVVVLVVISAGLSEYTEAAMGNAAKQFLGSVGGLVIVAGALFSMISASNASIIAGSRVALSMSRLGHFPRGFGSVNSRTRTPIVALVIVGGTILIFTLSLSLENLAHFADTVLLLGLILVNAALIVHRRKFPDMERPFRVPLVPLVPALGILANLYLLAQIVDHPGPMAMACATLLLGVLGFVAWKGFLADDVTLPGEASRVALERSASSGDHPFRILVPLANPVNVPQLIDLAAAIAADRGGEIIALRVAVIPEQLPPSREDPYVQRERQVLELAHATAREYDVPVTSLIRIGHDAARAILETLSERDCDLLIMGWKGHTSTAQRILGDVVDRVVHHATADVMLVKQVSHEPLRRFLLPTAGGTHARCAEDYIASLVRAHDGELTVCSVAAPDGSEADLNAANERLATAAARITKDGELPVDVKLISHSSVSVGIIQEAKGYDAIVVGASGEGHHSSVLFGSIPETVAKRSGVPVILVKRHRPVKALLDRVMGAEES